MARVLYAMLFFISDCLIASEFTRSNACDRMNTRKQNAILISNYLFASELTHSIAQ